MAGCVRKIPGRPEKIMEEYVKAVQRKDFETIFALNAGAARIRKFLERSEMGDKEKILKEDFEKNKAAYQAAEPSFAPGVRWTEKHYFPATALVDIGDPYPPASAGEDNVNAEYEMAMSVFVPVIVKYPDQNEAPAYNKRKLKTARYDCALRKIREGGAVRVYSTDDKWYFAGCVFDSSSVTYQ